MKKFLVRSALGALVLVGVAVLGVAGVAQARWDRTFDDGTPMPTLRASTDSAVIARGRYLAYGPAPCAYCHTTADKMPRIDAGEEPALSGGHVWGPGAGGGAVAEHHARFSDRDRRVERGRYLAEAVSDCGGCHTKRNAMDGSLVGPRFAGGGETVMEGQPDYLVVTPNLTPDSATGRITRWTEDQFVARFRASRTIKESPMPRGPFGKMSDDDLRSIFRYLRTLPPVRNATGESVQPKTR